MAVYLPTTTCCFKRILVVPWPAEADCEAIIAQSLLAFLSEVTRETATHAAA